MKVLIIILISVSIFSCQEQDPQYYADPLLLPYLNTFTYEAERLGVQLPKKNLILAFKDSLVYQGNKPAKGLCYNGNPKKPTATIYISRRSFQRYLDEGKYSLIIEKTVFHELGHAFGRHHNNDFYDSAYMYLNKRGEYKEQSKIWPTSVMTITYFFPKIYPNNREYYLKELFGLIVPEEREGVKLLEYGSF